MILLIGALAIGLVISLYLVYVYVDARYTVRDTPRADMFVCPVHGPLPKQAVMELFPFELDLSTPEGTQKRSKFLQCPLCLEDRIKEAKVKYDTDKGR